ncbi:MAG: helix-hairpin-helix domain-containing protein [Acidobacteriota bacterium]
MFNIDIDRRILAIGAVLLIITFGVGYKYGTYCEGKKQVLKQAAVAIKPAAEKAPMVEEKQNNLLVYVFGEVRHPGIYQMKEGSRVFEVLDKAEPTAKADVSQTSPATILTDQQNIQVPRIGQAIASGTAIGQAAVSSKGSGSSSGGIVNLNTATVGEIDQKLPGIGPTLAQRIIDYRQQSGGFKKIEDLKEVPGIGDRRFEQLKSQIRV